MQLSNVTLRLGGSLLHTVPKTDVTPAEILVLKHIHGSDAVVDIRPGKYDERRRSDEEFSRLSGLYDAGGGSLSDQPGAENRSVVSALFPGAMKKLPLTLEEIGLGDPDAMNFEPQAAEETTE